VSMRVCMVPDCPRLFDPRARAGVGRCPEHEAQRDRARGTKTERGYGAAFQSTRRMWTQRIANGGVNCGRCGQPITSADLWDLGHDDDDRWIIRGPECQFCNRSAAGKKAHRR
jgi:hypothetical protein